MKFPKSVHPEGWLNHIEKGSDAAPAAPRPAGAPLKPRMARPSAKIRATDPLWPGGAEPLAATVPPIRASAAPAVAAPGANPARRNGSAMPWLLGVGAGVVLIGVAATMSRQSASPETPAVPPVMVGEAAPQPEAVASSPEDLMLAEAPPAAGALPTPAPAEAAAPAAEPAPRTTERAVEAPRAAEAPRPAEPRPMARAAEPAPVTRTLAAPAETLAPVAPPVTQAAAPVVAPAAAPVVTPPLAEPVAPVQPPQAQPVQPPVLAQQAPQAPVADPADTGITVKVREALAADATLAAVPIAVSTDHGVVKLEGQAPDAQAKDRATVVAAATTGVRGVDNRLTLPPVTVGALQDSGR